MDNFDDMFDWEDRARETVSRTMRRKATPGAWTTAKGEVIAFGDMEHSHLLNTIAYVERQYRQLQDTFCDAGLDIDLLYPAHAGLVAEARRRNLIPRGKKRGLVTP